MINTNQVASNSRFNVEDNVWSFDTSHDTIRADFQGILVLNNVLWNIGGRTNKVNYYTLDGGTGIGRDDGAH